MIDQHYVPKNETVTVTIRVQNLSVGLTDTASVKFKRDSSFITDDSDELHEFGLISGGEHKDFSFEVLTRNDNFTIELELYDYFETRKVIPIYVETMKKYKGKDELIKYETPFPKEITIGQKSIISEIVKNIPMVDLDRETIGIVLGNQAFWDSTIISKPSITLNIQQVREYFYNLFGLSDYQIIPSQYWLFNDGITSNDFKTIFDPSIGYIKRKIVSSLEYSDKDSLDIIVYFSGEGTTYEGQKVILPYDANLSKSSSGSNFTKLFSSNIRL